MSMSTCQQLKVVLAPTGSASSSASVSRLPGYGLETKNELHS